MKQLFVWMIGHVSWVVVGVIVMFVSMAVMSGTFGIIASAEGEKARNAMMWDLLLALIAVVALRFVARWEGHCEGREEARLEMPELTDADVLVARTAADERRRHSGTHDIV